MKIRHHCGSVAIQWTLYRIWTGTLIIYRDHEKIRFHNIICANDYFREFLVHISLFCILGAITIDIHQ